MSKPKAMIVTEDGEPGIRCYDIEAGYTWMVTQDLIDKAVEEQS